MEVLENLRFNSVGRLLIKEYKKDTHHQVKNRQHNGFVFCVGGSGKYINKGKEYIIDEKHVMLAPKGCTYDLIVLSDAKFPIIDFELDSGYFNKIYFFEISEAQTFYLNYVNMEKQYMSESSSRELMGLSNLYDLTARINGYGKEIDKFKIIDLSEKYLESNLYNSNINIADVARQSNISEVYFRRLFKEKYNMSPYEYLAEHRIKRAREILLAEDYNISEIAEMCGFNSIYSFSRAFKSVVGMSPTEYKLKYIVSK